MKQTDKRWLFEKLRSKGISNESLNDIHDDLADHLLDLENRITSLISATASSEQIVVTGPAGADGQDLTLFPVNTINSSDSPYKALVNQVLYCDMSTGDVTISIDAAIEALTVHRDGTLNTLKVTPGTGQTIMDDSELTISGDKTTIQLRKMNNKWRAI